MPVRGETDSRPPRPSLPPLLVAGLVLWATTALLWPPLRLVPAQILPVAGTTALGLATLLAPRILRGVRAGGVPLGVLAALAVLASVAGLVVVMFLVVDLVAQLLNNVKSIFGLY